MKIYKFLSYLIILSGISFLSGMYATGNPLSESEKSERVQALENWRNNLAILISAYEDAADAEQLGSVYLDYDSNIIIVSEGTFSLWYTQAISPQTILKKWNIFQHESKSGTYICIPKKLHAQENTVDKELNIDLTSFNLIDNNLTTQPKKIKTNFIYSPEDIIKTIKTLLIPTKQLQNSKPWSTIIMGHGSEGTICNLPAHSFKQFVDYLNKNINVQLLLYVSCHSGNMYNLNIFENSIYNFPLICSAEDSFSRVYPRKNNPQSFFYFLPSDKYITSKHSESLIKAVNHVLKFDRGDALCNLPIIRWPNSTKFEYLTGGKIKCYDNQQNNNLEKSLSETEKLQKALEAIYSSVSDSYEKNLRTIYILDKNHYDTVDLHNHDLPYTAVIPNAYKSAVFEIDTLIIPELKPEALTVLLKNTGNGENKHITIIIKKVIDAGNNQFSNVVIRLRCLNGTLLYKTSFGEAYYQDNGKHYVYDSTGTLKQITNNQAQYYQHVLKNPKLSQKDWYKTLQYFDGWGVRSTVKAAIRTCLSLTIGATIGTSIVALGYIGMRKLVKKAPTK